jgi:hypothetical protein
MAYPRAIRQWAALPGGENLWAMPNLRGLLYDLLHTRFSTQHLQQIALGISASLVIVLLVFFGKIKIRPSNRDLGFSLAIVITLLASYHCYLHDLSLLLLPFLVTLARARDFKVVSQLVVFPALLAGMMALPFIPSTFPQMVLGFCLLLLLFGIALGVEIFQAAREGMAGGEAA